MTILTRREVKRMKIKVTDFDLTSPEYFDAYYSDYSCLLGTTSENTKEK